jgi:hypothetical protein
VLTAVRLIGFSTAVHRKLTLGAQCAGGWPWDWLGIVNHWEFPGELIIQLVYRTKPKAARFYYFDVNPDSPVRPIELFGLRKQMTRDDLDKIREEIKKTGSFRDLDVDNIMGGYRFEIPRQSRPVGRGGDPWRFFGIRYTCPW